MATDIAEPPAQVSSQVDPPLQLSEQLPVHAILQFAPPEQSTLALGPTVMSHVDVPVHLRLHESPQAPVQSLLLSQLSEQLEPHVLSEMVQACPEGHAQDVPLHVGGVPVLLLLLHAAADATRRDQRRLRMRRS